MAIDWTFMDHILGGTPTAETVVPTHARLWPGVDRALCTGATVDPKHLSVEAYQDEDADVTCSACDAAMMAASAEVR